MKSSKHLILLSLEVRDVESSDIVIRVYCVLYSVYSVCIQCTIVQGEQTTTDSNVSVTGFSFECLANFFECWVQGEGTPKNLFINFFRIRYYLHIKCILIIRL